MQSLPKKIEQKLYKMYTIFIQNTNFVYILHIKIVQIKILYDNECTKNVQTVQNLYKVQTKNDLKLEMYVFCTYKVQTIQNLYN